MVKLKNETYKGFVIEFTEVFDNNKKRAVELRIKENNRFVIDTIKSTKSDGFDWARDYIDNNYKDDNTLTGWKKIAKEELEKELNIKTRVTNYEYYVDKGGLSLESIDGSESNGESEWIIFKDYDVAYRVAIDKVKEDLINEPSIFSQDFIENHIDIDNLNNQLEIDAEESSNVYYDDIKSEIDNTYGNRQIEELVSGGFLEEIENLDEDKDIEEQYESLPNYDEALENAVQSMTEDKMSNGGLEYLKEFYSDEEAIEKAIEIGGIDYDEASEDAVNIDGVAHFLDGYDGEEVELPSGAVAYGTN